MNFFRISLASTAVAVVFLVSGCGGSGSSSVAPVPVYTSKPILAISSGSVYTYVLSNLTQTVNGVAQTQVAGGSRTLSYVYSGSLINASSNDVYTVGGVGEGGIQSLIFSQDSSFNLLFNGLVNKSSVQETIATPVIFFPTNVSSAAPINTPATNLSPSGSFAESLSTGGVTTITTKLGTFTGLNTVTRSYTIDGITYSGTYDFDPGFGSYITGHETVTDSTSNTITSFDLTLSSYQNATL